MTEVFTRAPTRFGASGRMRQLTERKLELVSDAHEKDSQRTSMNYRHRLKTIPALTVASQIGSEKQEKKENLTRIAVLPAGCPHGLSRRGARVVDESPDDALATRTEHSSFHPSSVPRWKLFPKKCDYQITTHNRYTMSVSLSTKMTD